jgi:hypothetical protein
MVDFVVICIIIPVVLGGAWAYREEIISKIKTFQIKK